MALASTETKNKALSAMADALERHQAEILAANQLDLDAARGAISSVMLDRLALNPDRIAGMAKGIREVVELPDPAGAVLNGGAPQRHRGGEDRRPHGGHRHHL